MKKLAVIIMIILLASTSYADPYGPYREGYIEGYLMEISQSQATIEEYDGTIHDIAIMGNAHLQIDGVPTNYLSFRRGMEVYGYLRGRSLRTLESYSTENPAYIPPGKMVRGGTIKSLTPDSITIRTGLGEEESYPMSPMTIISRKGTITSLDRLYEGDRVRLFFDEYNTNIPSRISLEGDSILVEGLYKGTLTLTDQLGSKMVLRDVKKLINGRWTAYEDMISISHDEKLPIYIGGQIIHKNNLRFYSGREAYMAVKNILGDIRIEKMNLKLNRERAYNDKIMDINYYSDSFELKNKMNLSLNEGTIIVKNNRLVDKYSLNPQSDVFLVSDGDTHPWANILYVLDEDLNYSNIGTYRLYYGRLDEIIDYEVLLRDYWLLDENYWDNYRRRSTLLTYDDDTGIYDMEAKDFISSQQFQSGDYAVDESSSYAKGKGLKDWYAYIFTHNDNILALGAMKDEEDLQGQRVTGGTIWTLSRDPYIGDVMNLRDSRDWSNRNQSFMSKSQDLRLLLEGAIIVKDERIISKEELQVGDRLYIVRDDLQAKFILVK